MTGYWIFMATVQTILAGLTWDNWLRYRDLVNEFVNDGLRIPADLTNPFRMAVWMTVLSAGLWALAFAKVRKQEKQDDKDRSSRIHGGL